MLIDPGYKFCPKCGSALSRRKLKAFEPERLVCTSCLFVMYLNPKVAAGAVVEYEGGVVLLRREIDPRKGFWVHPGGFVDRGETLEQAAIRETREEVGLVVELSELLGAYSFEDSEVVVVTYAATSVSGIPSVGDESLEVKVFAPREIPWDELAFPSTRAALNAYLRTKELRPMPPGRGAPGDLGDAPHQAGAPRVTTTDTGRSHLETLMERRSVAFREKDVRAASVVYPQLIAVLREARRFREALVVAEEGLGLTQDPLIARLADEIAHEQAAAEQERC